MIPEIFQQNFLNPLGLTALLSLVPLIIFYLVKPKPEKEVMPSMAFFTEEKQKGKVQNALRKLKRNKILILHILFVLIAASAIANPLIRGLESEGNSVIILDTSASVNDNRQEVRNYAFNHLGEQNTVIRAGGSPEVLGRTVSTERARSLIRQQDNTASGTDLVSALQLARNYPGKVVLASDMDHTATGNLQTVLENLASDRNVKVMDLDHENSHAFTDLNVGDGGEVTFTVQNFLNRENNVEIRKSGENIEETIGAQSTETFNVQLEPGVHEFKLPPDELALDNTLYVSVPGKDKIAVKRLGGESRYFNKAIQLINQTEYNSGSGLQGADVYYVSEDYSISGKTERLREIVDKGGKLIFESRENLPDIAPVENMSDSREVSVQVQGEVAATFSSSVTGYDVKGRSLSTPDETIVLSEDNNILLYNVDDETFGREITYPIFWKNTLLEMTETNTADKLNIKTGQQTEFSKQVKHKGQNIQGNTLIQSTGFYKGDQTYAANLLGAEESAPNINAISEDSQITNKPGKDPSQEYLLTALTILSLAEILMLSNGGAI